MVVAVAVAWLSAKLFQAAGEVLTFNMITILPRKLSILAFLDLPRVTAGLSDVCFSQFFAISDPAQPLERHAVTTRACLGN